MKQYERPRASVAALLAIVLPVFLILAAIVVHTVTVGFDAESDIRNAQIARANLTRAQLDQETGLRGYTSTGDRVFLEPYHVAVVSFPRSLTSLRAAIQHSKISGASSIVADMVRLHDRWIADVATPLLGRTIPRTALALQLHGKVLVDRFRADNRRLEALLQRSATRRDGIARQIIMGLFALVLLVIVGGAAVLYFLARSQAIIAAALQQEEEKRKRIAEALETQRVLLESMQRLFTQKALPSVSTLSMDAVYLPASIEAKIGGDWYDAIELPDGRVLFSIGDVAGHGVDAAVTMILVRQAIIASAVAASDPSEILRKANAALRLQRSDMATAICGYIDPATMLVEYSCAGHPPPLLLDAHGAGRVLAYGGIPLGIGDELYARTFRVQADPGSRLVLYTDGAIECTRDILAGEAALMSSAIAHRHTERLAHAISDDIFEHCTPSDDVAILTITFGAQAKTSSMQRGMLASSAQSGYVKR